MCVRPVLMMLNIMDRLNSCA